MRSVDFDETWANISDRSRAPVVMWENMRAAPPVRGRSVTDEFRSTQKSDQEINKDRDLYSVRGHV